MKTKLLIPENILYLLALFSAIFTLITLSFDFSHWGIPFLSENFLTYIALLCSFAVAFILIYDVFKNNIPGKFLWIVGFLISGGITGLFYLRNRSKYFAES